MKLRTLSVLLLLLAIAVFTAFNWALIATPMPVSLGLTQIQAPLGLILLGLTGLVIAVFLVYVLYLQSTLLLDARNHAKELQANRKLTEEKETSRFTELQTFLTAEFKRMTQRQIDAETALAKRLEQLEHQLRLTIEQSDNALAATLAEMDDYLRTNGVAPR